MTAFGAQIDTLLSGAFDTISDARNETQRHAEGCPLLVGVR